MSPFSRNPENPSFRNAVILRPIRAIQPFAHLIVRQPQTVSLLSLFPVHPEPLPFEEASRRFTHLRRNPPTAPASRANRSTNAHRADATPHRCHSRWTNSARACSRFVDRSKFISANPVISQCRDFQPRNSAVGQSTVSRKEHCRGDVGHRLIWNQVFNEGPSFGIAPSGTWMLMSFVSNSAGRCPTPCSGPSSTRGRSSPTPSSRRPGCPSG